jgi:phage tail sheath protein FI
MTDIAVTLTPGVYTIEKSAFPNSVVAVATAIPAFIGYTERADYKGKSLLFEPMVINSLNDFLTFFGAQDPTTGQALPPGGQYTPIYHLVASSGAGELSVAGKSYDLLPDPTSIYYLYNSIRLFYENGGGQAYVVSVGLIPNPGGKTLAVGAPLINPNVKLADLAAGLDAVAQELEPTMLVIPDGNLLSQAEHATLMQNMLNQCGALGSRVALLDIQAGQDPDPKLWLNDVNAFRTDVGMNSLHYGIAYYPYLKTTLTASGDFTFANCGGAAELKKILPEAANSDCAAVLNNILKPPANPPSDTQNDEALQATSPTYASIKQHVIAAANVMPPSGAMAGIFTMVDNEHGVWKAPANVSLTAVTDTTLKLTDASQAPLNVDAPTGKSVNAIRMFPGKGVIVWGARTLMGNSQDWRYINVRRTMIMIEQSIKLAAAAYVFEPNTASTWSTVGSMLTNFLTGLWSQGALAGASPADAFTVAVGLGKTMTAQDILDGKMNISVSVAITHPAEFIVITYTQQMQKS